ncbi:PREDICTED: biogenesis of lysosome-related organelles complex 1 subunit 6-like [Priapulus caudatus]|uniref:Biogenesis of lysosome-related organelles complex 1 subunit 6-like n=1 Tax=Priapulus caudatus TaxID=37621 RepID=A0ABM1ELZ3_PRICU|nr:PREDICTED: biogenesis of lysosome-related organelles complex 1 subunit 6-like [Priapulus caudatus]
MPLREQLQILPQSCESTPQHIQQVCVSQSDAKSQLYDTSIDTVCSNINNAEQESTMLNKQELNRSEAFSNKETGDAFHENRRIDSESGSDLPSPQTSTSRVLREQCLEKLSRVGEMVHGVNQVDNEGLNPIPDYVTKLTGGFLDMCEKLEIDKYRSAILEIRQNQIILQEGVQEENTKFKDLEVAQQLENLMVRTRLYQNKLVKIKKEMVEIHEKTTKVKKRVTKLQQMKEKDRLQKEQQRKKEQELERRLIAKRALT